MYTASLARPRGGFGGASTGTSSDWNSSMTGAQNEASAKPPWTKTTVVAPRVGALCERYGPP